MQGFSYHVAANSEELRRKFVDFDGKKDLTVERLDLTIGNIKTEDWRNIFESFVKQAKQYVGNNLVETLKTDFTTTTVDSAAVGNLSIMSALKHYFEYHLVVFGCGIPSVTVEGTLDDWEKIYERLDYLSKFDLKWWTNEIKPIIAEIIETKKGNINKDFWRRMVRIYELAEGKGTERMSFYDRLHFDGWFAKFYPYDKYGETTSLDSISLGSRFYCDYLPSEILDIPFTLTEKIGDHSVDHKCTLFGGFLGMEQNKETYALKPCIGWYTTLGQIEKE